MMAKLSIAIKRSSPVGWKLIPLRSKKSIKMKSPVSKHRLAAAKHRIRNKKRLVLRGSKKGWKRFRPGSLKPVNPASPANQSNSVYPTFPVQQPNPPHPPNPPNPPIPFNLPIPQAQFAAVANLDQLNFYVIKDITESLSYVSYASLMSTIPIDPNDLATLEAIRSRLCLVTNAYDEPEDKIKQDKRVALLRLFLTEAKLPLIEYGPSTTVKVNDTNWSHENQWHDQPANRRLVAFHGAGLRSLEFLGNSVALISLPTVAPQWPNLTRVTIIYESPLFSSSLTDGLSQLPNLVHLHISTSRFMWMGHGNPFLPEASLNRLESLYLASSDPVMDSIVSFMSNPALESLRHLGLINIQDGLAYLARRDSLALRARLETVLVRGERQRVRPIRHESFTRPGVVFDFSIVNIKY